MTRKQDRKITQLAKSLQSLARKAVTTYEREINEIVDSNCREKRRIECTLDGILDFCFDKNMLLLYKKLCRYYYSIDLNAATEYVYAYRDMWEPKDSNRRLSKN